MVTIELIAIAVLVAVVYMANYVWKTMTYWKVRGVKHQTPLPFVGNMLRALRYDKHFYHLYHQVYHAFPEEKMVGMYEFMTATLILKDPQLIKTVFVSEFSTFPDRGPMFFNSGCLLSSSVFNLEGNRWRAIRNKLLTLITTGRLKSLFPSMAESCSAFVDSDPKQLTYHVFQQLLLRMFSQNLLGLDMKSIEAEFLNNFNELTKGSILRMTQQVGLMFFPRICNFLYFKFMPTHLENYFRSLVNTILNIKPEDSTWKSDIIRILNEMKRDGKIHFCDKENNKEEIFEFTDELAQAQLLFFLIAALEPSSIALIHLAYDLAQSPDAQKKARQEVKALLQKYGGFSWECVKDMKYLDCCLKETLRLHPPLQFLNRICNKPTELGGVKLDKGTRIAVPVHSIHLDPVYFPDPKKYSPERFLDDQQHKSTYLPFSEGPRICIGSRLFMMQALIIFAQILDNFELTLSKEMKLPVKYEPKKMFLTPKQDSPIIINLKRIT